MQDKNISRLELIEWLEGHKAEAPEAEQSAFAFILDTLKMDDWALLKDN